MPFNPRTRLAPLNFSPAVVGGMPFDQYRAVPAVSKSFLDKFERSALAAKQWLDKPVDEQTDAMLIGSMLDKLIFNPSDWSAAFYVQPTEYESKEGVKKWNNNALVCQEWHRLHADKPVLTLSEYDEILRMAETIAHDKHAQELIRECNQEQMSFFAAHPDSGLKIKGRPDWCSRNKIVDLKKTKDATTRAFSRQIIDKRYHVQMGHYQTGLNLCGWNITAAYFIAVEGGEFPQVNVRRLEDIGLKAGAELARRELVKLRAAIDDDAWPGLSGAGAIQDIELPAYAINSVFDLDHPMEGVTEYEATTQAKL